MPEGKGCSRFHQIEAVTQRHKNVKHASTRNKNSPYKVQKLIGKAVPVFSRVCLAPSAVTKGLSIAYSGLNLFQSRADNRIKLTLKR